ncbi:hypothetical protein F4V91_00525 [Neorhizobium galegae]|uniref:Uncharacterized protein n=1 Tax=Neorhizobium galegae TaxID=399 RepID=A0A6A1TJT7_NEOGA|nr:hypothetical protein [Neorhizobium galegae]KAB1085052.1 hypothetical protein F4V91_00525 [Neorhizobium galegae]
MRGHLSGDRELLPFPTSDHAAGNDNACALAVQANFNESLPVGPAELDAIEAFLMPQILKMLTDLCELPTRPGRADSEEPQSQATNKGEDCLMGASP